MDDPLRSRRAARIRQESTTDEETAKKEIAGWNSPVNFGLPCR
jgi:hypothetical protein